MSDISLAGRAGLRALVQISEVIPVKNTLQNLFYQKIQTIQNQANKNQKKFHHTNQPANLMPIH